MNEPNKSALWAGLVVAQRAAKAVAKDGKNTHHGYKYATSEDVIEECRTALNVGGLALLCDRVTLIELIPAFGDGTTYEPPQFAASCGYLLVHESGAEHRIESVTPVMPEKGRPYDKAVAAALTYNLAYSLRSALLVPRGEQDHPDNRNDRDWQPMTSGPAKAVTPTLPKNAARAQVMSAAAVLSEARLSPGVAAVTSTLGGTVVGAKISADLFRSEVERCRTELAALIRGDQEDAENARRRASDLLGRATLGTAEKWLANASKILRNAGGDEDEASPSGSEMVS